MFVRNVHTHKTHDIRDKTLNTPNTKALELSMRKKKSQENGVLDAINCEQNLWERSICTLRHDGLKIYNLNYI